MEIKGNPAGLGMAAVMVGSMVVIAFVLGVPEIFGISFRWGWAAIDRGHTEIRALTPKIATVESRAIFLAEGEELAATYDLQLSSGRARMSVYGWGWLPAIGDLTVFHQNPHIQRSTRQDVRLVSPAPGFYRVSGAVVDATGTFTIDWQVNSVQRQGQGIRLIRGPVGLVGLLMGLVVLVAGAAGALRLLGRD